MKDQAEIETYEVHKCAIPICGLMVTISVKIMIAVVGKSAYVVSLVVCCKAFSHGPAYILF
jgi:hypothetical protein